jgi:hypothetical protein
MHLLEREREGLRIFLPETVCVRRRSRHVHTVSILLERSSRKALEKEISKWPTLLIQLFG